MANDNERRALVRLALTEYRDFMACLREIKPGLTDWSEAISNEWGPGTWSVWSRLMAFRQAAEIMGFRLDMTDLKRHAEGDSKLRMIPEWERVTYLNP